MVYVLIYHGVPEEKLEHKLTLQFYSKATDIIVSNEAREHHPGWVHFLENWGRGRQLCSNISFALIMHNSLIIVLMRFIHKDPKEQLSDKGYRIP